MTRFTIYGLRHPVTKIVRYVGKTTGSLKRRLSGHLYQARSHRTKTAVGTWIRQLQDSNQAPEIVKLGAGAKAWQRAERRWILKLREAGNRLLNKHAGGNGAHARTPFPRRFLALLGKISDARLAELIGRCRETVTYHRHTLGIGRAFDTSRMRGAPNPRPRRIKFSKQIRARLGYCADSTIAKQLGVSKTIVSMRRQELGISPYTGPRNHRYGVAHHEAKLTQAEVEVIRRTYRRKSRDHGCPALAARYQVHPTTIHQIVTNQTWRR